MGKKIWNDNELAGQLENFLKRLEARFDQSTPAGRYFAHAAHCLSEQRTSFFASLAVKSYGQLKNPVQNNLPHFLDQDKIIATVLQSTNDRRTAASCMHPEVAKVLPSISIQLILAPNRKASYYGVLLDNNTDRIIGKRHPFRIAQEAMRSAAKLDGDPLYERALYALECYVLIDTSIFEIYKRIANCYDKIWDYLTAGDNSPLAVCDKFDPYGKAANPQLDYRFRENLITPELVTNVANLL